MINRKPKFIRFSTIPICVFLFITLCSSIDTETSDLENRSNQKQEPTISAHEAQLLKNVSETVESDPEKAIRLLSSEITSESSAALDFALGNLKFQQDQLEEAENAFGTALEKLPGFYRARMNLVKVLIREEKFVQAGRTIRPLITSGQANAEIYTLLGYISLSQGRATIAETAYQQALLLNPDDSNISTGLAKCLLEQERYHEAIQLLENLVKNEPNRSELWLLVANAYLAIEKTQKAIVKLESARRLGILSPEALATLGDLYLNSRQPEEALTAYKEAFSHTGYSPDRLLRAAEAFLMIRKPAEADTLLEQIKVAFRKNTSFLDNEQHLKSLRLEAQQAYLSGNREAAEKAYKRVLEENPLDGDALLALGDLHREAGELEEAIISYERAARISEKKAPALVKQAQVEVERERYAQAVELLQEAQAIDPQPNVARYLEQIKRNLK